jgi:hypothetical protein
VLSETGQLWKDSARQQAMTQAQNHKESLQ